MYWDFTVVWGRGAMGISVSELGDRLEFAVFLRVALGES